MGVGTIDLSQIVPAGVVVASNAPREDSHNVNDTSNDYIASVSGILLTSGSTSRFREGNSHCKEGLPDLTDHLGFRHRFSVEPRCVDEDESSSF